MISNGLEMVSSLTFWMPVGFANTSTYYSDACVNIDFSNKNASTFLQKLVFKRQYSTLTTDARDKHSPPGDRLHPRTSNALLQKCMSSSRKVASNCFRIESPLDSINKRVGEWKVKGDWKNWLHETYAYPERLSMIMIIAIYILT